MTWRTSGRSSPRQATSVATSTRHAPEANASSARDLAPCVQSLVQFLRMGGTSMIDGEHRDVSVSATVFAASALSLGRFLQHALELRTHPRGGGFPRAEHEGSIGVGRRCQHRLQELKFALAERVGGHEPLFDPRHGGPHATHGDVRRRRSGAANHSDVAATNVRRKRRGEHQRSSTVSRSRASR